MTKSQFLNIRVQPTGSELSMPWHYNDVKDILSHKGLHQQITTHTSVCSPLKPHAAISGKQHQDNVNDPAWGHREDLAKKETLASIGLNHLPRAGLFCTSAVTSKCRKKWFRFFAFTKSNYCVHLQIVLKSQVCFLAKQVLWILSCSNSGVTQLSHLPQTRMNWVLTHRTGLFSSVWNPTDKHPST